MRDAEAEGTGACWKSARSGTPTIVHFCAVLLVSGLPARLGKPHRAPHGRLEFAELQAVAYVLIVIHTREGNWVCADRGDWFWYIVLPLVVLCDVVGGRDRDGLANLPPGYLCWLRRHSRCCSMHS